MGDLGVQKEYIWDNHHLRAGITRTVSKETEEPEARRKTRPLRSQREKEVEMANGAQCCRSQAKQGLSPLDLTIRRTSQK